MRFLIDFLRQKAPKPGREIPIYYRKALIASEELLAVYFPLCFILFRWLGGVWMWMPALMFAGIIAGIMLNQRTGIRINLMVYAAVTLVWSGWYIYVFGWTYGGQQFIIPLMMLIFFNIYEPPWLKIGYFMLLVGYRLLLYHYSLHRLPLHPLESNVGIVFQTVNSLTFFLLMMNICILFSSSIQDTERQLRLANQELHREAGTDPLTQLPNRRAMMDELGLYLRRFPDETFSVAIADIDFFKKVNDTYGHNCGDYTLKTLSDKFREVATARYFKVCRWGGEEFCFFLPGKNIDDAGKEMFELCDVVRRMPLCFGDNEFMITITIGVEEYDFRSSLEEILEKADQKLYMGKLGGRDQVVI